MNVYLNAKSISTPKSINDLIIGYLHSDPTVVVFLYDPKKNTLLPLKYGDNESGIARARGLPVGDTLQFYYTSNFKDNDHWRNITIDLKHSTVSNVDASRPAGITFLNK